MENSLIHEFMEQISDMRFLNVDDLFIKKTEIRHRFRELDKEQQEMYKWYFFYQLCLLKNPLKSTMWNYVIGENNAIDLDIAYNSFCIRREKLANLTKNGSM